MQKGWRNFALYLACCFIVPCVQAELQEASGTWALRLGSRTICVLHLNIDGSKVSGYLDRPAKFSLANLMFSDIRGGTRRYNIVSGRIADGAVHFVTQNPNEDEDKDSYLLIVDKNKALLNFDDIPASVVVEPFTLVRVADNAQVATDWEPNRAYSEDETELSSAAMQAIFDADQEERAKPSSAIDPALMARKDAERRTATRNLIASGALHSGQDFENAAFVFQHGDQPEDYLLAHTLAIIAITKGKSSATWISAATLDRYLQNIGQKQIYGTQFRWNTNKETTQEPYQRDLISDTLRRQMGVPGLETQEKQVKAYSKQK